MRLDFYLLMFNVQANVVVNAHVLIGDPDQGEKGDEIAAPISVQKPEASEKKEYSRDIMAEAVFAGKQVKKLPARQ